MIRKSYSERLTIAAEQNDKERNFWLNQLSGELLKTGIPFDYKEKGAVGYDIDSLAFLVSRELATKSIELSKGSDYTLNLLLLTGVVLLLYKYTGSRDIMVGTSIYKQEIDGNFINTVLVLRNRVDPGMSFRDFLRQVRQTLSEAVEHQNYPIELLAEQLGMVVGETGAAFFDVAILLENVHNKKFLQNVQPNIIFSFTREGEVIKGVIEYNTSLYEKTTIEKSIIYFMRLLQKAILEVDLPLTELDILTDEEKYHILYDFNRNIVEYPLGKTIHKCFEEQVEKTPGATAVAFPLDLSDIYEFLKTGHLTTGIDEIIVRISACCFKKNPYIFHTTLQSVPDTGNLILLKTHRHDSIIINQNTMKLLRLFDGNSNVKSIYTLLKDSKMLKEKISFHLFTMRKNDLLEVSFQFNDRPEVFSFSSSQGTFEDFARLVHILHNSHIIGLAGMNPDALALESSALESFTFEKNEHPLLLAVIGDTAETAKAQVLLLGDTPGTAGTGLLYLASYLVRNGVTARCQFYDPSVDYVSMKENIEMLLGKIQPQVVAVSMKWFLYIARVLDMCNIIKEYSSRHGLDIKVIVGGNTASYYWKEIIAYNSIDYVVRGDGEEPLLKIVRGEKDIPNCIYKENREIIENPITYIQDEKNSTEIYLSHLDEILLDKSSSLFGTFFIYTQKGCAMNCLYCGGCNKAQQKTFNRKNILRRGVEETRKDIIEVKKYASTLYFEFDILDKNIAGYCRKIWEEIDLSGHFCLFNSLTPPSIELVELVSQTFKYVYWDFDICTPSERHRKQLDSLGLVKPQPTDAEIIDFLSMCEKFKNIEVRPNLITGLPYFTIADIEPGEKLLSQIISSFSCFGELHWARLHAQPGAPILEYADQVEMHSFATSFADFLECSAKTFNRNSGGAYVSVEHFNYPYIYFKDDHLNSLITKFYLEINQKVKQHKDDKVNDFIISEALTYAELNEKADRLAAMLVTRGVKPGDIVGLMLERSTAIPVGILAVLKCDAAYLPIDPEFPAGRIDYMLKDSSARLLIKKSGIRNPKSETNSNDQKINDQNENHHFGFEFVLNFEHLNFDIVSNFEFRASNCNSSNLAYIIYTSGTTGKPKGVAIRHENLINYVNWFSQKVGLTAQDKTILTTSYAFDLGYTSLYNSLLNGCELHILPREIYLLAERLLNYIRQNEITFIKVTPSLFSVMVNSPVFSRITCQSLRLTAMGGEPINVKDLEKAHSICSHLKIMNHYGPTETTIGCAAAIIDFADFEEYKVHPVIGKPIANAEIYILGKDMDLLPVGVPGELCICGAGVGLGYLNQPELTNQKFLEVRKPFFKKVSGPRRVYCTGDLARWLPNGTIEFLGRIDTQIKIRGYRIELGEIESRLAKHPAVEAAVAVVKEAKVETDADKKGYDGKYICAYIVSRWGNAAVSKDMVLDKNTQVSPVIERHQANVAQFMDHVKTKYDEIAVKSNNRSLTYGSLNNLANRAAQEILANYDDRYKLSKSERTRYKRQMLLHGWGIEAQEKLKSVTVFVAGAGGGASPTIVQLALAGVGTIKVCDFDEIELSNLNRQFLHDEERLGMNKALSAQMTVKKINPHVNVIPYTGKLTRENIGEWVGDADIIFDMFDGPADKFILSEFAVIKKIPHIIISMTDINAYTAVLHTPHTPCYHCLFDKKKLETIVSGMENQVENYSKNPLPVVATSLFISTGIAVNEGLKILLGFKKPAYNKFFYFNQRGQEDDLVFTPGYKAMTYLFSDHFIQECQAQRFDWDIGWRGNFLEELTIKSDPQCPLCSDAGKELRQKLEEKMKKTVGVSINEKDEAKKEQGDLNTVSILLNPGIEMAVAIMGALKAGKSFVPLNPTTPKGSQIFVLEDSEARVILTDDSHLKSAEKLRDKCNRNIKIININNNFFDSKSFSSKSPELYENIKINPASIAYLMYPPDPMPNSGFNHAVADLFSVLIQARGTYNFSLSGDNFFTDSTPLPIQLRDHLLKELPEYMIPSHFIQLEKIPLTPNGKLDKKALPDPKNEKASYAAPQDNIEVKLTEIWADVLGREKDTISINDNFFQLGGHSLNATIMIAKAYKELDVKIPLSEVFKTSTLERLARYIKTTEKNIYTALQPIEEKDYYSVSSAQKRMFLVNQLKGDDLSDNTPSIVRLEGDLNKEHFEETIRALIKRHETFRTFFVLMNDIPIQRIHKHIDFNIEYFDISDVQTGEMQEQMAESIVHNFVRPFNLGKAPLLRVGLIQLLPKNYILMYDLHHIINDNTSSGLFLKDFTHLYQGLELPPLRIQYKDFTDWQNNFLNSQAVKKYEDYWLKVFSGQLPYLNMPTDYPRPEVQSFVGDFIFFELGDSLVKKIQVLCLEKGMTVYMIMLAIYNILLSKYSGQEDIILGTPIAGRDHPDLQNLSGMFVNTLALRNYPKSEKIFAEFLTEIKFNTLDAFENQNYQFEQLVERLGLKRESGKNILFNIMFAHSKIEERKDNVKITDFKIQPYPFKHQATPFDMVLYVLEGQEQIFFKLMFRIDLYRLETIEKMSKHFVNIVEAVINNIQIKIGEITMLSNEDKKEVLTYSSKEQVTNLNIDFNF